MKTRKISSLLLSFFMSIGFVSAQVNVTGATGVDPLTNFTTLRAAINAIGSDQLNNNIKVAISESTTETAQVLIGNGTWASLKIFPTATAVTVSNGSNSLNTSTLIKFNGAKNVFIEGRQCDAAGGVIGTSRALTLDMVATGTIGVIHNSNGGSGYTSIPAVAIAGGGTTATATATMGISSVSVSAGGSGYTTSTALTFSGGAGTQAKGYAIVAGGAITQVVITEPGAYTSLSGITCAASVGSGFSLTINSYSVMGYTLASNTNVCTSIPTVTIAAPTSGTTATAEAQLTGAATIEFATNAQENTIQYCTIKGSSTGVGTISIGTASATNGNGNNTINNNIITGNAAGRPVASIIINGGTSSYPNSGNKIQNNEFKDFLNPGLASFGIKLTGSTTNTNLTISGNSFYETTAFNPTSANAYTLLNIGTIGAGCSLSGNYIGGSAAMCSGTFTKTKGVGNLFSNIFTFININATAGSVATIDHNTIDGFDISNLTGNTTTIFDAISIGNGDVDVISNTIGNQTSTGTIKITNGAATSLNIINCKSAGVVNVKNNTFGSITIDNTMPQTTNIGNNFYVILRNKNTAGNLSIDHNIVGGSVPNSIHMLSNSSNYRAIASIVYAGSGGTLSISNNEIRNMTNAGNDASKGGTITAIITDYGNVYGNTIHDLVCGSETQKKGDIIGVFLSNTNYAKNVYNNSIYNLTSSVTGYTGNLIGIQSTVAANASTGNIVNIYNNFVYGLSVPNATATYTIKGIDNSGANTGNFYNNIISLGTSDNATIYGYNESGTTAATQTTNCYHNTVYISGAATGGNSYGFNVANNTSATATLLSSRTIKNNIIVNARTGGTTNNSLKTTTGTYTNVTRDNNDLVGIASPVASGNEITTSPEFSLPGTTAVSYLPSPTLTLTGAAGTGITTDFDGTPRSTTPRMGAYESGFAAGNINISTLPNNSSITVLNGGHLIVDGNKTLFNVTIEGGGKVTNTSNGVTLTASNFKINSDATNGTGTYVENGGALTVSGTTKVNQYLTAGRNWYISSPLSLATSNAVSATSAFPLYYYDETLAANNWTSITNTTTELSVAKGYVANLEGNGNASFTGGVLNTGALTTSTLTNTPANTTGHGFNLVGNPYPSYIDWSLVSKSNVSNSIWYRSKSNGSYIFQTYNVSGSGIGTNGGTNIIPPMQSFWVRATAGTATLGFNNTMRSHQDQSQASNRLKVKNIVTQQVLRLEFSNSLYRDEAVVYFNSNALDGFDEYDSPKMTNNNPQVPEIYTIIDSKNLAINGLSSYSAGLTFPLGLSIGESNTYTIKATEMSSFNSDIQILLKDDLLKTEYDLSNAQGYSFSSDVVNNANRFSILFKSKSGSTAVNNQSKELSLQIYKNSLHQVVVKINGEVTTNGTLSVFNVLGNKLKSQNISGDETIVDMPYSTGVYIVTIKANGKESQRKVVIN